MRHGKDKPLSDPLHITIGVSPSSDRYDLTPDLRLLKAALLYADEVKLCSLSTSMLKWMQKLDNPNFIRTADSFVQFYDSVSSPEVRQAVLPFINSYRSARSRLKYAHKRNHRELREITEDMRKRIRETIAVLTGEAAQGIDTALSSKIVELEFLDIKRKSVAEDYFEAVANAVISGETYPLFDDFTSDLIGAAIEEGKLIPMGVSVARAKQTGLSSDLFYRLPLFDKASVKEVLDIRKELSRPLMKFRAAMVTFSKEIEAAPWHDSFTQEAEAIYREYVVPAVLEIEDACKSNKSLLELGTKALPETFLTGLGILLDHQPAGGIYPEVVGKALIGFGLAGITTRAIKEWRERKAEIRAKQLYFYYGVRKRLN